MKLSHSICDVALHFVFVTKFRKPYDLSKIIPVIKRQFVIKGCDVLAINCGQDHVHCVVEIPSRYSIAFLANVVKSVSSSKGKFLGGFPGWQNGYFVSSVGWGSLDRVRNYVDNQ